MQHVSRKRGKTKKMGLFTQYVKMYRFLEGAPAFHFLSLVTFLVTLLYSLLGILEPEILRRGVSAIEAGSASLLAQTGVWALIFGITFCAATAASRAFEIYASTKMLEGLQVRLLDKILRLRKGALEKFTAGSVISNMVNNLEEIVDRGFMYGVVNVLRGVCMSAACVVYMAVIDWRLCIAVVLYDFLLQFICKYAGKKLQKITDRLVKIIKSNNGFLIELLNNMITVRAFHRVPFFSRILRDKEEKVQRATVEQCAWEYIIFDSIWMGMKVGEYLVMYGFGGLLVYWGTGSIAAVTAFVSTSMLLIDGINFLVQGYSGLKRSLPSIDSINEILENEAVEPDSATMLPQTGADLRCEHLRFSYGEKTILDDVSFTIHAGERVLIRGENGSGKSTLLRLISGLYQPDAGRILYGNADVTAAGLPAFCPVYRYISQTSNILEGDVYENLSLHYGETGARCDEVLRKLRLSSITDTQPKQLSEGEKQRLNIGRALYRKDGAAVILGDEIFANIDRENAERIAALLSEEFREQTLILVCHETVSFPFDRVLLVENGKVQEVNAG